MKGLITVLFALCAVVAVAFNVFYAYGTTDTFTITVTEKERIVTGGEQTSSKWLVFTAEHDVLENTDSLLWFKFNSSSVQGQLMVGETYTVNVYGWRSGFLSWYPNIISIVE